MKKLTLLFALIALPLARPVAAMERVPLSGVEYLEAGELTILKTRGVALGAGDQLLLTDARGGRETRVARVVRDLPRGHIMVEITGRGGNTARAQVPS